MKKLSIIALVVSLAVLCVPSIVGAAHFEGSEMVQTSVEIFDDTYLGGVTVGVSKNIEGDLFIGAGTVNLDKDVLIKGDVFVGGGNVNINSNIAGDLRVGGGQVFINSNVSEDVFVAGGSVQFNGIVEGNVYASGGDVVLSGEIKGDLILGVEDVILKNLSVDGNISGMSYSEVKEEGDVSIVGEQKVELVNKRALKNKLGYGNAIGGFVLAVSALIVTMLVVTALMPLKSRDVITNLMKKPWRSLGFGFAWLILVPFACLILLFSMVGTSLSLIVGAMYLISLYVGMGFFGIFLGSIIVKLFKKNINQRKPGFLIASIVVGMIVLGLIGMIPYAGAIFYFIGLVFTLGAMFEVFKMTSLKKRSY